MEDFTFPMRINKFLAHKGFTTRRGADTLIDAKRVFVNGKPAIMGQKVTAKDVVELKNHTTAHYRYLLYYKPRGIITHSPEGDEVDIETQIKKDHKISGLFPIGRLDKDSEGLIILTNDGRITERILNPEKGHERVYEVAVDKRVTQTFLNRLERGVDIEGYMTKTSKTEKDTGSDHMFTITLTEGKKHQVRRMCAALGYQVRKLKRTRMLNLELKKIASGGYHELKGKELTHFYKTLGLQ